MTGCRFIRECRNTFVKLSLACAINVERSSFEALPTCEDSAALYADVVKTPGRPVESSSPALVRGLPFRGGDPPPPTGSPSTSHPEARSKRPGPLPVRSSSSQSLVHPGSGDAGAAGGGSVQDSPLAEAKAGRRDESKVSRSMTDSEMHRAHGPPAHGVRPREGKPRVWCQKII